MPEDWDTAGGPRRAAARRAYRPGGPAPADPGGTEPDAAGASPPARRRGGQLRLGSAAGVIVACGALVAGALALTGGGGGVAGPLSPVAQAAESTGKAPGSRFAMTGSVNAGGLSLGIRADGAYDGRTNRTQMDMAMDLPGAAAAALPGGGAQSRISIVSEDLVAYMRSPLFAAAGPGFNGWIKLDLSELGDDALQQTAAMDPRAQFEQLMGAGDAQRVGSEEVRGVKTTRYAVTVDLTRSAEILRDQGEDEAAEHVELSIEQLGGDQVPVEVWVDSKKLLRRMTMSMPFEAEGTTGSIEMTIELFAFGAQPQIQFPPPGPVLDASSLSGGLPGFGG